MRLLVAIPTYNECANITPLIDAIFKENLNNDLLFIDDNSSDGTLNLINLSEEDNVSPLLNGLDCII